ncbi:hypothetical protein BWR15_30995, partial [Pseudomonas sp. T]
GKAAGAFSEGDVVSFKLNGTDYSAKVAADGTWSVKVAGADLAAETNIHATLVAHDSAGNVSDVVADHAYSVDTVAPVATLTINVVAHDSAGNVSDVVADHAYSVDTVAPVATLTINVVAGDDIVNLEESKVQQTVSGKAGGEFQAGDVVSFKLNGTDYSAKVSAARPVASSRRATW